MMKCRCTTCACVRISREWNSLNNSNLAIRAFQKSGFRHQFQEYLMEILCKDESHPIDYVDKALIMEDKVANPSECVDIDAPMHEELHLIGMRKSVWC